jgi:hypothetical protein
MVWRWVNISRLKRSIAHVFFQICLGAEKERKIYIQLTSTLTVAWPLLPSYLASRVSRW